MIKRLVVVGDFLLVWTCIGMWLAPFLDIGAKVGAGCGGDGAIFAEKVLGRSHGWQHHNLFSAGKRVYRL